MLETLNTTPRAQGGLRPRVHLIDAASRGWTGDGGTGTVVDMTWLPAHAHRHIMAGQSKHAIACIVAWSSRSVSSAGDRGHIKHIAGGL